MSRKRSTRSRSLRHAASWVVAATALIVLHVAPAQSQSSATAETQELGLTRPLDDPRGQPLDGEALDEATVELSSMLRCPVCQNLSVADSPSPSALAIRDEVRDLFAQGYERDQIVVYFEQRYGEFVRLVPKFTPFNVLVWIVPAVGVIAGVLLVLRTARVRKDEHPGTEPEDDGLEDYRDRVRQEIAQ